MSLGQRILTLLSVMIQDYRSSDRERLINPNKDSKEKIEEYWYGLGQIELTMGKEQEFTFTTRPDVIVRPKLLRSNAPEKNFVFAKEIRLSNVHCMVGFQIKKENEDGGCQGENGMLDTFGDSPLDLPTLTPGNKTYVRLKYTGRIPEGYKEGDKYTYTLGFFCPATVTF
jgi:hypothetical protein